MHSRLCDPPGSGLVSSFTVFKEQCVTNSWTILGLVGIKVKFQASSIFRFQSVQSLCFHGQQVFIWNWSASCKNNLAMCVMPLYISEKQEFSVSAMWLNSNLNCYQFPSPIASLCFYIFTFLSSTRGAGKTGQLHVKE